LATLEWDQVGERVFETGVDRGVLYLKDGRSAAWNGLRSVDIGSDSENASFYLDGVKYLHRVTPGDFTGKLTALTYPDEFDEVSGMEEVAPGMHYYNQQPKMFDLSYRTRIGNDLEGTDHGYKLHVLYNLLATVDQVTYPSISETVTPIDFGWTLNGTPPALSGHRPTIHISIDSRDTDPSVLAAIEDVLYGTDSVNPRMPPIDEITNLMAMFGSFVVVDNGDGTWTGIDLAGTYIVMNSPTQFTVNNVDATYSDTDTYDVSTTNPD
jgi:hypothetical protein